MTLYGEAKKAQSSRAGIYHLQHMMVNGESYWVHASGEHAIWLSPNGWWSIGEIVRAGTDLCSIYTEDAVSAPQKASDWKYADATAEAETGWAKNWGGNYPPVRHMNVIGFRTDGILDSNRYRTDGFKCGWSLISVSLQNSEVGIEYQYIKPASFVSESPVEILNGIL